MGSGARKLLTVSNRRTVGLVSRGQECPLVVSMGETMVRGPRAAYALVAVDRRIRSPWAGVGRERGGSILTSDETAARFAGAVRLDAG
ncbi:MAG: hypothetical protein KDI90_02025 [Alphaproteobacteria bacterium]|nr:hypothetical protein [Alphaproteobacteria bacterium]